MIGTATRQVKLAAAVTDVEDHAALAALEQRRVGVAGGVELTPQTGIDVGVDVPRTELLGEEFRQRLLRRGAAEVNHDGDTGDRARLDGPVDGNEVPAHVVCRLDPHDQPLVAQSPSPPPAWPACRRRSARIVDPAHPVADDVEEREDAGPRAIDDSRLEILEISPAGAAGVGHGWSRPTGA